MSPNMSSSDEITRKLESFLLKAEDIKIARKLAEKYGLNKKDFVNISIFIFFLITRKEKIEETPLEKLIDKYLENLPREIKEGLKRDIILEIIPLIHELWKKENTLEESYEERERRYFEIIKSATQQPLILSEKENDNTSNKKETHEDSLNINPEDRNIEYTKQIVLENKNEYIGSLSQGKNEKTIILEEKPNIISWTDEDKGKEFFNILEKERYSEDENQVIQIELKEEKKNEDTSKTIDLSEI